MFSEDSEMNTARTFSLIVFGIVVAISAVSTGGFMFSFGGPIVAWLVGSAAADSSAAVLGAGLLEGMATFWFYASTEIARSKKQIQLAGRLGWTLLALGVGITIAFTVLSLQTGNLAPSTIQSMRSLGTFCIVVAVILNIVGAALFVSHGPERKMRMENATNIASITETTIAKATALAKSHEDTIAARIADRLAEGIERQAVTQLLGQAGFQVFKQDALADGFDFEDTEISDPPQRPRLEPDLSTSGNGSDPT